MRGPGAARLRAAGPRARAALAAAALALAGASSAAALAAIAEDAPEDAPGAADDAPEDSAPAARVAAAGARGAASASGSGEGIDPAGAARDHQAGLAKLKRRQYADAVALLRRALERNPASPAIANDLGFALARAGNAAEAERLYRRAIALDARRVYAYVNFADLAGRAPDRWHRRAEVVALLGKGMAAVAGDAHAEVQLRLALADFERRVGRLAEARRALEPAGAATAPAPLRKRALDLAAAVAADEAAQALDDWPAPALPAAARVACARAEALLAGADPDGAARALELVAPLVAAAPAADAPRFLRARALEALERHDEAARELAVLVQVRPSHARAWRLLGTILARHGGTLEADRADEALRRALALEPSWDDLRALRRLVAERRAAASSAGPAPAAAPPSRRAVTLAEEADRWMLLDSPEQAVAALREAIKDSPTFVDAAVSLFALAREVPPEVPAALWDDGAALARLSAALLALRRDEEVAALVAPWLERAVAVGAAEARFERALLRADAGDRPGALDDLVAYVASGVAPPRLSEARALRASLEHPAAPEQGRRAAHELARLHLLADRPREAERALGGPCRAALEPATLVELGRVREYAGELPDALGCYRLAAAGAGSAAGAGAATATAAAAVGRQRLARLAARLPPAETLARVAPVEAELQAARVAGVPEAPLALAALARARAQPDEELAGVMEFLVRADADDPLRGDAASRAAELRARAVALGRARAERRRLMITGAVAAAVLAAAAAAALVVRKRFHGAPVERALRQHPELYPEVARVVAEIRHDVLKHRVSALGLASVPGGARREVARALLEPEPASAAVAAAYERLRGAAAAQGATLRPLGREPIFGPLARDLARAEALLAGARGGEGDGDGDSADDGVRVREGADQPGRADGAVIAAIDRALRERHGDALARLGAAGPRTRLDPARLSGWLRAVEAEQRARALAGGAPGTGGAAWTAPELHLQELDLELPVTEAAVSTVLANLLRNAEAAVRGGVRPRIVVRVGEERDASGRRLVTLLVADSAEAAVTTEDIARRAPDRGLGIVRELVRRWGGHLIVRRQDAPLCKAIGAAFPAPAPAAPAPSAAPAAARAEVAS